MSERLSEAVVDFANAVESACVQLKRYIGQTQGAGVKEETFLNLLGWTESQGNKIGKFEYTTAKANNSSDAFRHAYNILKANNATISSRFHDQGYRYSYWLYNEKEGNIYRQLLKTK